MAEEAALHIKQVFSSISSKGVVWTLRIASLGVVDALESFSVAFVGISVCDKAGCPWPVMVITFLISKERF